VPRLTTRLDEGQNGQRQSANACFFHRNLRQRLKLPRNGQSILTFPPAESKEFTQIRQQQFVARESPLSFWRAPTEGWSGQGVRA
jgi:hypothetical protein